MAKAEVFNGTGRRKTAIARVRVTSGQGKIRINRRELKDYFAQIASVATVRAPLVSLGCEKAVDIDVRVTGGGVTSQAGAVQLGLARALLRSNDEFEDVLREKRFLTRDSRKKERKKYGKAGARRSFQFSKR